MGTLQWRGWKVRCPEETPKASRGGHGEGYPHPQPNTGSGERRELPQQCLGAAEPRLKTNLAILLLWLWVLYWRQIVYVDDYALHTRKLNKKVSYRKQIARQHSRPNIIWPGQAAWSTFCLIGRSLITTRFGYCFSYFVRACKSYEI